MQKCLFVPKIIGKTHFLFITNEHTFSLIQNVCIMKALNSLIIKHSNIFMRYPISIFFKSEYFCYITVRVKFVIDSLTKLIKKYRVYYVVMVQASSLFCKPLSFSINCSINIIMIMLTSLFKSVFDTYVFRKRHIRTRNQCYFQTQLQLRRAHDKNKFNLLDINF